MKTKNYCK